MSWLLAIPALTLILYIYVLHNDRRLSAIPARALAVSPRGWTREFIQVAARKYKETTHPSFEFPPKTGRRYIIVGGGGFLGGWIVVHLLKRGEDPRHIRVLDIAPPKHKDLLTGAGKYVQYFKVDISDGAAVEAAFHAPWPVRLEEDLPTLPDITVFHAAANIRFYEHHIRFIERSYQVNVQGTKNVINSSVSVGATVLIYTSSGSVAIRRSRFLLEPWRSEPPFFVQALDDRGGAFVPKNHEEFFSNYAATKAEAERLVRGADGTISRQKVLRTGCLRPSNGIFGPGGDILCEAYLRRKVNPSWNPHIMQSFIYVENCVEAHLLYEQRFLEILHGSPANTTVDLGGECFTITDPNPPPTYGDIYLALQTLSDGKVSFPRLSVTCMFMLAHITELYHHLHYYLSKLHVPLSPLRGNLLHLQPSLFALISVHLLFDDSRARRSTESGGLGYRGGWTTLEGVCKTVEEHRIAEESLAQFQLSN